MKAPPRYSDWPEERGGDLVVWDNIAVQHARTAVANESRRTLRRVTVSEKTLDEICAAAGMVTS